MADYPNFLPQHRPFPTHCAWPRRAHAHRKPWLPARPRAGRSGMRGQRPGRCNGPRCTREPKPLRGGGRWMSGGGRWACDGWNRAGATTPLGRGARRTYQVPARAIVPPGRGRPGLQSLACERAAWTAHMAPQLARRLSHVAATTIRPAEAAGLRFALRSHPCRFAAPPLALAKHIRGPKGPIHRSPGQRPGESAGGSHGPHGPQRESQRLWRRECWAIGGVPSSGQSPFFSEALLRRRGVPFPRDSASERHRQARSGGAMILAPRRFVLP